MTIISALPFLLQNGTTADATQVEANFDAIVADVNANAAANGVNTDITALTALVTPLTPAQGGASVYYASTSGGSANAQTVASPTPTGFTLVVGKRITFLAGFTNTGATTLNVNSTGATSIFRYTPGGPVALIGGEIIVNNYVECIFDGTRYILVTNASTPYLGPLTNLASATTTDLGTISSHNISITGTTTITGFGSSASTTYPLYKLAFADALLLTYNATSLIIPGSASITTATGDTCEALYLGSGNWQIINYTKRTGVATVVAVPSPTLTYNYLSGLTLSYSSVTVFGIAAGAANDSTNASAMVLPSAFTKTTSAWAVGTGNGGLDTGAIGAASWYHVYLIQRPDTGLVDVLYSLSASAPTMPANYTLFRRIGSIKTAASQWVSFTQTGDQFIWAVTLTDVNNIATVASRVSKTLTVPTGVVVDALIRAVVAGTNSQALIFTSLQETDQAPVNAASGLADVTSAAGVAGLGNLSRLTNTSAQIGVRATGATTTYSIYTYGWIDSREK